MISVLILTLDEERNIPGALASLRGRCSDVVLLDSYSGDNTVQLARDFGARVIQRKFDNYASQRNAGLALDFANDWVLMIDADERVPPDLWAEMEERVRSADGEVAMFRMRRKDMFLGRWIKRSSGYPTWFGRLVRRGRVRVEREINEEYVALGKTGNLQAHLVHYPFNRGLAHWIDRHNSYSTFEALKLREELQAPVEWQTLFSRDPVRRRKALKRLAYRLPMRPTLVFAYLYIVRLGLLDGRPGFIFCRLRAAYELLIDAKRVEEEWLESGRARRDV